jgi:hypothetical protein
MKQLFLTFIAFASVYVAAQGTQEKKPLFSKQYDSYRRNDSALFSQSSYTYYDNRLLIKEIVSTANYADSTVKSYGGYDRILSSLTFRNKALHNSKFWDYDTINRKINYYESELVGSSLGNVLHTVYEGVQNFNETDNSFSSIFVNFLERDVEMRDCDSISVYFHNQLYMRIKPKYQDKKINSVKVDVNPALFADLLGGLEIETITISFITTYNGDTLTAINGRLTTSYIGMPIDIPNAIVLKNQYENGLLIETKTEMNLVFAPYGEQYVGGAKQNYYYNSENDLAFIVEERCEDGTTWTLDTKTYFEYETESEEDIALIALNNPSGSYDNIGSNVYLEVFVKNSSFYNPYSQISITALIKNSQ